MFTIETETGFTVATDTADEFDHALASLDRLNQHIECTNYSTDNPLKTVLASFNHFDQQPQQPTPCTCDADRPAPPPIPDGSINPTEAPFIWRARELGGLSGSAELNEIDVPIPHVAKQQAAVYSGYAPQGSGDPQVDPEELLANTIEQRDHVKADREVMYLRERLANANGTIEGLRGNLREQATQLGRVMEEREKVSILCNQFVDLAKRHGWSPASGKMPVEQISEWLDIFVRTENECKALREQLARAAEINLSLEDRLAVLAYKWKGKGKVQIGD